MSLCAAGGGVPPAPGQAGCHWTLRQMCINARNLMWSLASATRLAGCLAWGCCPPSWHPRLLFILSRQAPASRTPSDIWKATETIYRLLFSIQMTLGSPNMLWLSFLLPRKFFSPSRILEPCWPPWHAPAGVLCKWLPSALAAPRPPQLYATEPFQWGRVFRERAKLLSSVFIIKEIQKEKVCIFNSVNTEPGAKENTQVWFS